MTCAVTSSNDPFFSVGNVFTSVFQYNSDSIDGTFYSYRFNPHGTTSELSGKIRVFWYPGVYSYEEVNNSSSHDWSWLNHITITNGVVSDFLQDTFSSVSSTLYRENYFIFRSDDLVHVSPQVRVDGTVSFDTPIMVPEGAATAGLLGFALIALAAFRRRYILS